MKVSKQNPTGASASGSRSLIQSKKRGTEPADRSPAPVCDGGVIVTLPSAEGKGKRSDTKTTPITGSGTAHPELVVVFNEVEENYVIGPLAADEATLNEYNIGASEYGSK